MGQRELDGRVAIVTGSSRGIGRACAHRLAEAGASVAIVGRDRASVQRVAEELRGQGGETLGIVTDVSDEEQVKHLFDAVEREWGAVDILVNNAGIAQDGLVVRMRTADWMSVLATNLSGAFYCSRLAVKGMIKRRSGAIINMTSVIGSMGNAGQANYAASKGGLEGFTKSLAREVASRGITVNAVAPGYIDTEMTAALDQRAKDALLSQIPLQRVGHADDVAYCVVFLASPRARYITGQVLHVNGGLLMP